MKWWNKPDTEQRIVRLEKAVEGIFDCLERIVADLERIEMNIAIKNGKPRLVVDNERKEP